MCVIPAIYLIILFQILTGNLNAKSVKNIVLSESIDARFLRMYPLTWNSRICLRTEIYGCAAQGNVSSILMLFYWPKTKTSQTYCSFFVVVVVIWITIKINKINNKMFNFCFPSRLLTPVLVDAYKFVPGNVLLFSRSEFKILWRAEIASGVRFCFVHKFFYRFGIRSCLAKSHKRILKTQFSMTSSCIFGFQAARPPNEGSFYSSSVYCALANCPGESQSSSEANNSGLQTQQCPIGQVAENPCRGRFNTKRTATWTSAKVAKKTSSAFIERTVWSPSRE